MDGDGPPKRPSQEIPSPLTSQEANSSQERSQSTWFSHSTPSPLLSQNALRQLTEMIPVNIQNNQSTFYPNYWNELSFYTNSSIPVSQVLQFLQTRGSQPLPVLSQRLSQELTSAASTTTVFDSQEAGVKKERSREDTTEEEIDVEAIGEPKRKKMKCKQEPIEESNQAPVLGLNHRSLHETEEKPLVDPSASDQPFGYSFPQHKKSVDARDTPKPPQVKKPSNFIPPFCVRPLSFPPFPTPPRSTTSTPPTPPTPILPPPPTQPSVSSWGIPYPGPGSPFSPLYGSVGLTRHPPPKLQSQPIPITPVAGSQSRELTKPVQLPVPVAPPSPVIQHQTTPSEVPVKFRVFMVPQMKCSKNLDYVSGTKRPDVDGDYFVYARDQVEVPFNISVNSSCKTAAKKIKVKIIYKGTENAVPRCANHQEPDKESLPPEQLIQFTTPADWKDVEYLSYTQDGGGFILNLVPSVMSLVFHCRNSCHTKSHKDFCLQFTLLNKKGEPIATREMALKIVQVPLRDIRREGIEYEVIPEVTGGITFRPFAKEDQRLSKSVKQESSVVEKKEEQPLEEESSPSSQLHIIYVHGDESYARLMRYVKMEEDRKRSTASWRPLFLKLNSWTSETPIQELLTHACGPIQADPLLAPFEAANIRNLGEMAERFDSKLLSSLGIEPSFVSAITSLFLNWYNCKRYDDL